MNQGTRWVLLMQKNRHQKYHAWAPLKIRFTLQEVFLFQRLYYEGGPL
jgi:hypothetical protein